MALYKYQQNLQLFLNGPQKFWKTYGSKKGMFGGRQKVYEYFKEEYFMPIKNEAADLGRYFNFLIPGRIYTYKYWPQHADKLAYYDRQPMMLCLKHYIHPNTKNNLQVGINLNFIPPEIRVYMIDQIVKGFKNMILQDIEHRKNDTGRERNLLLFTDNFDYYKLLDYLLETVLRSGWKFAIRQYIWENADNIKMVDYADWMLIPFIFSKDFVGASPEDVYQIYWDSKRKGELNKRKGHTL